MRTRSSKEFQTMKDETEEKPMVVVEKEKEMAEPMAADSSSDEQTVTLEDVDRAKTLFTEGKRNYLCGSMAEAADALSQACKIFAGYYGESAFECVEAYYYYGRTLLELARKEPDVVGGAVEGTCYAELDKDDEQGETAGDVADAANGSFQIVDDAGEGGGDAPTDEEVREQVLEALEENAIELEAAASKKAQGVGESAVAAGEKSTDVAGEPTDVPESSPPVQDAGESDGDGKGDESEEDDKENAEPVEEEETPEEVSNLQLSWEMLDLARTILEKRTDDTARQRLADCRLALGEQAMEDEQFDKAITEFDAALGIQKEVLAQDDRGIALCYYNIGLAYNSVEKYEEAAESFKLSVFVMEMRRANLNMKLDTLKEGTGNAVEQDKAEAANEISELDALIVDVQLRVQDCIESRTQTDAAKPALEELTKGAADKDKPEVTSTTDDLPTTDVSHLVRKSVKRASGGNDVQAEEPNKKAKLDGSSEMNGKNGYENGEKNEAAVE